MPHRVTNRQPELITRDSETVRRFPGVCKGCGREIWWVRQAGGRMMPEDNDGTTHFATCPAAEKFRKPAQRRLF